MKEKRKLSPGDRIKFVGWAVIEGVGAERFFADNPEPAVVDCLVQGSDASLRIKYRGDTQALIHRRQVVSVLKPKKAPAAPERERVERWQWVSNLPDDPGCWGSAWNSKEAALSANGTIGKPGNMLIHLVELREGERILSRADLARAWDKWISGSTKILDSRDCAHFESLCDALGLEEREP